MKNFIIYLLFISLFFITSCNKINNEELVKVDDNEQITQLVYSDNMLSFKSIQELENTINELLQIDDIKLSEWYKSRDKEFTSLDQVYNDAIINFENIKNIEKANYLKKLYAPYLLFNDNPSDEELYNPYLPTTDIGYSLVCNKNGDVEVAGEIINCKDIKNVIETDFYKISSVHSTRAVTITEEENRLYIRDGNRKMWARTHQSRVSMYMQLSAHKYTRLTGWTKYRTSYYISSPYSNNLPMWGWKSLGDLPTWLIENPDKTAETGNVKSGTRIFIGRVSESSNQKGYIKLMVSSRGVSPNKGTFILHK